LPARDVLGLHRRPDPLSTPAAPETVQQPGSLYGCPG
jgi:hypothetical protein